MKSYNLFRIVFIAVLYSSFLPYHALGQTDSASAQTIVVHDHAVFDLRTGSESLTLEERASLIESRLEALANANDIVPDSFSYTFDAGLYRIAYGDEMVMVVSTADSRALGVSQREATEYYLNNLKGNFKNQSLIDWMLSMSMELGLSLLVLVLLYFIIRVLNKLFTRFNKWLIRSNSSYLKGVKVKNYEFLSKDRMVAFVASVLRLIKWIIILLSVYLSLPLIFSLFPGTEGITTTLLSYVVDPLKDMAMGFVGFVPNLITIVVIIAVARYFSKGLRFLSQEVQDGKLVIPGFFPDWAKPTYGLLRVLLYAFAFIVIFPYLPGSDSPVFQGVSVFLGLLVSLGSSSAISNLIAGLVITYMRAFKPGDRVKIGETTGDVIEKTMLVTRVRTAKNEDVTIPNSNILNSHTTNYSSNMETRGLILHTTITIGYDVSWVKVHELLKNAAKKTQNVLRNPEPFILQTSLDDFYVSYELNVTTRHPALSAQIYSDLHANILDAFNEAQIEILSPHYRAGRDGSDLTIPETYKTGHNGQSDDNSTTPPAVSTEPIE